LSFGPGAQREPEADKQPFRYRPALDGLRGVAVLLVITRHVVGTRVAGGGPVGVGVFFALSGYLITNLLLLEQRRVGRIDLGRFYLRRAARLLPALVLVLAAVTALTAVRGHLDTNREAIYSLLYLGNWAQIWGPRFHYVPHTWSLAVEEHFYLVWPVLLIVLLPRLSRARALWIAGATLVLGLVLRILMLAGGAAVVRVHYGSDTRADAILIGSFVAIWLAGQTKRLPAVAAIASWLVLLLLVLVPAEGTFMLTAGYMLIAVAGVVVVTDATRSGSVSARVLDRRPLVWVGKISYGLYLWHLPIILWLGPRLVARGSPRLAAATISALIAVAVAAASSHWVERPILRRVRPARD
jgi:peptidoglycan/LPS O-acetylase OafA/YrhL